MRRHRTTKPFKWNSIIGLCLLLSSVVTPAWAGNEVEVNKQVVSGEGTPAFGGSEAEISKKLVGVWGKSTTDKESGDIETTLIKFNANGAYSTRLQSKLFGEAKKSASGRYFVTDAVKETFTLKIEVLRGHPDLDKSDRVIEVKIRMLNANTLQSEDGQVVRRLK